MQNGSFIKLQAFNCFRLGDTSKHNVTTTVSGLLSKMQFLAGNKPFLADILALR